MMTTERREAVQAIASELTAIQARLTEARDEQKAAFEDLHPSWADTYEGEQAMSAWKDLDDACDAVVEALARVKDAVKES